jgi:nucleolar protein 56
MRAVLRWYGVFLVDGDDVVEERPFEAEDLPERLAAMMAGRWEDVDPSLADPETDFEAPAGGGLPSEDDSLEIPPAVAFGLDMEDLRRATVEAGRILGREALRSEDQEIIRIVEALDDLHRAHVLVDSRVRDWKAIAGFAGTDAGASTEALRASLNAIKRSTKELEKQLDGIVNERAPNLTRLIGSDIAGRLIERARGLDRLARMPAGTIQVLGAEKAFFRHLKGGGKMPKHGHLYMHPWVHRAPRKARGKAARALAAKTAIAARADAYGGDLGDSLVEQMEARSQALATGAPSNRRPPRK